MEEKKLVKIIGGISVILGCYYLLLLYTLFDITHNVSLILNINTSRANYENALITLFIFITVSIIPLVLYIIGGFLVFKLREGGRKIIIGAIAVTLLTMIFNTRAIFIEIKENPIINTIYYFFCTVILIGLLLFLNSHKVKTIFHAKPIHFPKYQNIIGAANDILVDANVIRRGQKAYLPAWTVIATFLLPIFLIYLAIERNNIIFAWLIIPCMIIFPLIGGYVVKRRKQQFEKKY